MSHIIRNRPAAIQSAKELADEFQPGTTVRSCRRPERQGTVRTDVGRAVRAERVPSGYVVKIFVVWDTGVSSWMYASDLMVIRDEGTQNTQ